MSALLKNSILKELNSINWDQEDSDVNSDFAFQAIIDGIYNYMNDSSNITFTGVYSGLQLTPIPTPITGTTTHALSIINTTWLDIFKTIVRSGVAIGGIQRIFLGINMMLLGTVLATLESATLFTTIVPPSGTPIMPIVFPSITSFGEPCNIEIQSRKPDTKEKAWEIIAKYIHLGLSINVVPPIPFTGSTVVAPAVATTIPLLVFK
jgi:hypothetical protein